jgi:hypothetical protein
MLRVAERRRNRAHGSQGARAPGAVAEADGLAHDPRREAGMRLARRADVRGEDVALTATLAQQVSGEVVALDRSAAGLAVARELELRRSASLAALGAKLDVQRSAGQWLIGGVVRARRVFAVVLIAARVDGNVRCLFDTRGAFAFGAGVALVSGLLRLAHGRR